MIKCLSKASLLLLIQAYSNSINFGDGFFLTAFIDVHFAHTDDLPHDFWIVADGLGLAVNFLDVLGQFAFFGFKPLDPLDEGAQAGIGFALFGKFFDVGVGHNGSSFVMS
jgi:hypothetical protein